MGLSFNELGPKQIKWYEDNWLHEPTICPTIIYNGLGKNAHGKFIFGRTI